MPRARVFLKRLPGFYRVFYHRRAFACVCVCVCFLANASGLTTRGAFCFANERRTAVRRVWIIHDAPKSHKNDSEVERPRVHGCSSALSHSPFAAWLSFNGFRLPMSREELLLGRTSRWVSADRFSSISYTSIVTLRFCFWPVQSFFFYFFNESHRPRRVLTLLHWFATHYGVRPYFFWMIWFLRGLPGFCWVWLGMARFH